MNSIKKGDYVIYKADNAIYEVVDKSEHHVLLRTPKGAYGEFTPAPIKSVSLWRSTVR